MEKIKIKIHPTFVLFACILIYFGKSVLFFNYLLVIFLHELAHGFVAKRLGYKLKDIKLIPFGICLNILDSDLTPNDEIKIALAGPIVNFILAVVTMSLWWVFPYSYNYTCFFCYANFITGIFNLIPAFPLDGGRVFLSFLKQKFLLKTAIRICKIFNLCVAFLLLIMFIISCFFAINFTYLLVLSCVLCGIFDNNKQKYSLINYGILKKIGKVLKSKSLVVFKDEKMYKVCKFIDNFSYIIVYIIDENKKVLTTLTEQQFLFLLENFGASTKFSTALKLEKTT